MSIEKEQFLTWKKDPVTLAIFEALKQIRINVELGMVSEQNILSSDCATRMARLLGYREALDTLLEIDYESLEDNNGVDVK